ncbi:50S ribosomal protein L23 [Candidatus Nucleicultrix amoebiphila]|jgi:large subunit ribosomal protein L23|uniref:50S ribosomal protein L23 n=1 Tax=Candidatus Nucleicultrix amoebiphila TaxID=1509244 RepID=UPI000A267984|nr:50S ribosomal protein L23 [Candidatus Nucleicultrix amoebiphila]
MTKKATTKKTKTDKKVAVTERAFSIIKAPLITEKATLVSQERQFVFLVCPKATKKEIKEAVEAIFKVKVEAVNTLINKGKEKRFRGFLGQRSDKKKAYVKLAEGHTIDVGAVI